MLALSQVDGVGVKRAMIRVLRLLRYSVFQIYRGIVAAFYSPGCILILLHETTSQNSVADCIYDISCGYACSGNVISAGLMIAAIRRQ
ncbi:hypothetical protein QMZ30_18640 [Pantoea sp. EA-12]|uniref:hypothetical protein n=1 Tax=Pantoea sp. EA-12 TaxID=3043303 RepID=UPI0024B51918|nr:hypothetical protein [Pantoea sp. EA-12]MDI9222931.1 hypothetical protein [Pantoea sp. EA-12]